MTTLQVSANPFLLVSGCITITKRPLNVAGIKGVTRNLVLTCAMNLTDEPPFNYLWANSINQIFIEENINDRIPNPEHYTLQNAIPDQWKDYSMVVDTSILDVADRYHCHGQKDRKVTASAHLLLLGR